MSDYPKNAFKRHLRASLRVLASLLLLVSVEAQADDACNNLRVADAIHQAMSREADTNSDAGKTEFDIATNESWFATSKSLEDAALAVHQSTTGEEVEHLNSLHRKRLLVEGENLMKLALWTRDIQDGDVMWGAIFELSTAAYRAYMQAIREVCHLRSSTP